MRRLTKRWLACLCACLMGASLLSGCGQQQEETFEGPYEPDLVTIFCAYGAGTGVDMQGRQTFNIMKREGITDANFLFENFPGASGQVGFAVATQQRAGDYNLIFVLSSTMAMLNEIQGGEYSYKDMIPIGQVADDFNAVVVPGSSPIDTLDELIEASQEEELVGGCSGAAGVGDILINRLKMETDLQARVLPFEGNSNTISAILGDQIDFAVLNFSQCMNYMDTGEMKVLAVTSSERMEPAPEVPTLMELGINIEQSTFRGFAMLEGTPQEILDYWEGKLEEVVQTEAFQQEYCAVNGLTPHFLNAEDFKARLDAEYEINTQVLTEMGLAANAPDEE